MQLSFQEAGKLIVVGILLLLFDSFRVQTKRSSFTYGTSSDERDVPTNNDSNARSIGGIIAPSEAILASLLRQTTLSQTWGRCGQSRFQEALNFQPLGRPRPFNLR